LGGLAGAVQALEGHEHRDPRIRAVRAIVTGGAGFIGSHVADALVAREDEVWIVDNFATGKLENVNDEAAMIEHDVREPLNELFEDVQPDVCFHLAAQADVGTSVERPDYDADVNVIGTLRVVEAARKHETHVVFASTGGAIYGECEGPAPEHAERRPVSPYGISKLAGEEYLAGWNRLHGAHHVSLRFANVYGPRQEPKLEGGVIAIFMERMRAGQPTEIFGDGLQTRDFVYVDDVVQAVLAAANGGPGVYNVGTGIETSVVELHELCRRVTGSDREAEFKPPRPGDARRSVVDPSLAARDLGWRPQFSLEDGLEATWRSVAGKEG
jgi:UDP-glucose 4-epimerase